MGRVIEGPQDSWLTVEVFLDPLDVEGMVTRRNDVNAQIVEPVISNFFSNTLSVRCIFSVYKDVVDGQLLFSGKKVGVE